MNLSENALTVLRKRYFKKDNNGESIEDWKAMIHRVAGNIAGEDKAKKEQYMNLLDSGYFLPNSPTLMNAGNDLQQLSACFVLPIEDSMDGIFNSIRNAALIHKSGGGTGFSFSRLREANARVRSTNGVSSGPLSFLNVFNAATDAVKQGGTRRGANMAILRVDHPEILDFITSKEDTTKLTNFNISVGITETFMNAVYQDEDFALQSPHTKDIKKTVKARDVFSLIIDMAHKNGEPGVIFLDRINQHNPTPHIGEIESTNPCFHPDTLISTENGLQSVKELFESSKTISIATDDRVIKDKIEHNKRLVYQNGITMREATIIKTGTKPTIEIILSNGQKLKVTEDHKLLTTEGWKEAECLTKQDTVLVQSGKGNWAENDNIGADLALFLGWLIGDGWITSDAKVIGMSFSEKEKYICERMQTIAEKMNGGKGVLNQRENGCWQLLFKRKDFVQTILDKEITIAKAPGKRVPKTIFTASEQTVGAFLNALFSADGTINFLDENHRDARLCSTSILLLQEVQLLLLNQGIFSNLYKRTKKNQQQFEYTTKDGEKKQYLSHPYYELIINGDDVVRFHQFTGSLIHMEKETKLQSIDRISRKKTQYYANVKKILPAEQTEVYDIIEPVTHSLIANGMVAHNCGEQPLLPNEACNLGSINLAAFYKDGKIDWDTLKATIHTSVEFLDDVIDHSKFPLSEIEDMVKSNRKIGLGIMGWADLLYQMKIPYDSEKAIDLAETMMEFIDYQAKVKSCELAKEKGSFPNFEGSVYQTAKWQRESKHLDWQKLKRKISENGIRNATVTTIAPTGTLSMIANTSGGIEPQFSLVYVKNVMDGEKLLYANPYFEEAVQDFSTPELLQKVAEAGSIQNLEDIPDTWKNIFVVSHDISPEWHIKMQAAFQKYTDNAVSKTINFPQNATKEDIRMAFELAYELECKGVTVYRDGSRENQVLTVGETSSSKTTKHHIGPRKRPLITTGITQKIETGCGHLYVTINSDENGACEVFTQMGKVGGCASAQLEAIARLTSLCLRSNVEVDSLIKQFQGIRCPAPMYYQGELVTSCADAIAKSLKTYQKLNGKTKQFQKTINLPKNSSYTSAKGQATCPDCGSSLEHEEGCMICHACGWSKC